MLIIVFQPELRRALERLGQRDFWNTFIGHEELAFRVFLYGTHYIREEEPGRVMNLTFFAYHDSEPAPVERVKYTDAQGNVVWGDPILDEEGNAIPLQRYAREQKPKCFH